MNTISLKRKGQRYTGICQHCRKAKVNRPRGLCWSCYYTPGVKDRYSSTSKYAHRGIGNGYARSHPASRATDSPPGSAGKLAELERRASAREDLWHSADATWEAWNAMPETSSTLSARARAETWTVTVPNYLPPSINEYIGCRAAKRHRLKSECASLLGVYAVQAGVPRVGPDNPRRRLVRLTLYGWPRGRTGDPDNFLKAVLDGLKTARLIVDDSPIWCEWATPTIVRSEQRLLTVEIQDLPARAGE